MHLVWMSPELTCAWDSPFFAKFNRVYYRLVGYNSLVGPVTFCLGQVKFYPTTISKIEGSYGDKNVFFWYHGSGKLTWRQ